MDQFDLPEPIPHTAVITLHAGAPYIDMGQNIGHIFVVISILKHSIDHNVKDSETLGCFIPGSENADQT